MRACVIYGAKDLKVEDRPEPRPQAGEVLAEELELVGTFRFHEEFQWAVDALPGGRVNLQPVLSQAFTLGEAVNAFELASDRRKAMKVSLVA